MVYLTAYPWYIQPPTHGILTPFPWYFDPSLSMIVWTPYPLYFDPPTHSILTPYHCYIERLAMVFWPPYHWDIEPPIHGILNPLPMVFRSHSHGIYPYIHGILTPYICYMYIDPYHGTLTYCRWYLTRLPMLFWPHYPWYLDNLSMVFWPPLPTIHGISNPWYFDPLSSENSFKTVNQHSFKIILCLIMRQLSKFHWWYALSTWFLVNIIKERHYKIKFMEILFCIYML